MPALTIWYDASCPLCAAEMGALLRNAPAGQLTLIDCSPADFHDDDVAAAGFARADLMRLIHARDAAGHWLRGVDVFVRAYRLAGIESVARVFGNRRLRPLWDRLYPWVARHRMLLSRLHLNAAYGWAVGWAARRAARRARTCADGRCDVDSKRF
jgi:predicted DCC family thiol-disulfide oxidoreductase YuxK